MEEELVRDELDEWVAEHMTGRDLGKHRLLQLSSG
jgi:hypothetical protein